MINARVQSHFSPRELLLVCRYLWDQLMWAEMMQLHWFRGRSCYHNWGSYLRMLVMVLQA